jgi:sulfonate transport system substrate-binding protein
MGEGASGRIGGIAGLAGEVTPSVAQEELRRTALDIQAAPGDPQRAILTNILPIALADADIKSDEAGRNALSSIIEPKYAQQAP